MKADTERLFWGGASCFCAQNTIKGVIPVIQFTKMVISKFSSGLDFGEKTTEKSGSGKVSKTQGCLVFVDFLPAIVKIPIVGYSYPKRWLLPVILSYLAPPNSLSVAFCAILNN